MRLLVVSEEAARRRWVTGALGPSWTATEATNGRDALRIAEEAGDPFHLVVTDETAEPFGAFGLARELKMGEAPPAVIVLLERAQDTWLARWSGADRWFVWPADAFEVADAAVALVSRRARTS